MKRWVAAGCAVLVAAAGAVGAVELPDCGFPGWGASKILSRPRSAADSSLVLIVAGDLRNGVAQTFGPNDPVLVADLSVAMARTTLVPSVDIVLKSSWPLSLDFAFPANTPIPAQFEVVREDGRRFQVVRTRASAFLFINEQGRICNKYLNASSSPHAWAAGTLSLQPEDAVVERQVSEEVRNRAGLRIIFNGVGAGQLSFQEVWVKGPNIVGSRAVNFDQFAKQVSIGPFDFDVIEAGGGKVTLQYNIPDRMTIAPSDTMRLPLPLMR